MQKLRDSVNVKKYVAYVAELEKRARGLAEALVFFIENRVRERLIISYHDLGYTPAYLLYTFMLTMDPDKHVILEDCNTVQYYVVPYRDNVVSILYSTNPYNPSIASFMQTSRIMGNETLLVTIKPRDERLKQIYSNLNAIQIDADNEAEASMLMSIATYHSCVKLYRGKLGFRGAKLFKHGEEGLSIVVEDLISKYVDALESIFNDKPNVISSSSFLKPTSIFVQSTLDILGFDTYYVDLDRIRRGVKTLLILATSIDEHSIKRVKFSLAPTGIKVNEIVLNTDPLEAHIYLILLFYYLIFTLSNNMSDSD